MLRDYEHTLFDTTTYEDAASPRPEIDSMLPSATALTDAANGANAALSIAQITATKEPTSLRALPIELWIEICTHVDHATLWLSCRQVSHKMRVISEKVVKDSQLSGLELKWYVMGKTPPGRHPLMALNDTTIYETGRFLGYSQDGERAHLELESESIAPFDVPLSMQVAGVCEGLSTQKHSMQKRHGIAIRRVEVGLTESEKYGVLITLSFLADLQIDEEKNQISFLWKLFLTDFLTDILKTRVIGKRAMVMRAIGAPYE
ncbi:hypothetical protein NX059_011994 [Plenodomus lindquistii]|nr:hypothetical protein NX059_011994 [Plenodomus lindquistii]